MSRNYYQTFDTQSDSDKYSSANLDDFIRNVDEDEYQRYLNAIDKFKQDFFRGMSDQERIATMRTSGYRDALIRFKHSYVKNLYRSDPFSYRAQTPVTQLQNNDIDEFLQEMRQDLMNASDQDRADMQRIFRNVANGYKY
jgi:glutamyl-tRNA reductase